MTEYFALHQQLADRYRRRIAPETSVQTARAVPAGDGFVTELAGKLILTAPAASVSLAAEIPEDMRDRWERASTANPYFQWVQGRFVEAERANRNGAFWSIGDLQFGEMSVKHGPLNWLHEGRKVIGSIADNALIHPPAVKLEQVAATTTSATALARVDGQPATLNTAAHTAQPRPYIAAVSAVWKWLYPEEAKVIDMASDNRQLYYSMECVAREMQCLAESGGCGESFDYFTAMTEPDKVCAHIAERSGHRRMVDPYFLGGAVIVPPTRPGWGEANAEVMRQAAALAEQVAPADAAASEWELLMAAVLSYAAS